MSWWDDITGMAGQQGGASGGGLGPAGNMALQGGLNLLGGLMSQSPNQEDDERGWLSINNIRNQAQSLRQLKDIGSGRLPTQAELNAQKAANRTAANYAALAQTQGGALAARMAAQKQAMAQGSVAGASKQAAAQERLAAQQALMTALGQYGGLMVQSKYRTDPAKGNPIPAKEKPARRVL